MIREFLDMLFGPSPDQLIELRSKPKGGVMRSEFFPARSNSRQAVIEAGQERALHGDVYVGVCPRKRTDPQTGGAEAVERTHVLWVDCDTPESVDKLHRFDPQPACVVRSGSGGVHAYWPVWPPVEVEHIARGNRRLAAELGADMASTDPARILRLPGTRNWKHDPPRPVAVERMSFDCFTAKQVVGKLVDPVRERPKSLAQLRPVDDLEHVTAEQYFARLTGMEPNWEGMVTCPFPDHGDRTPSCHLYEHDWFCFGCSRGGRIYDLAAIVWGLEPRGDGFKTIRARLSETFGLVAA